MAAVEQSQITASTILRVLCCPPWPSAILNKIVFIPPPCSYAFDKLELQESSKKSDSSGKSSRSGSKSSKNSQVEQIDQEDVKFILKNSKNPKFQIRLLPDKYAAEGIIAGYRFFQPELPSNFFQIIHDTSNHGHGNGASHENINLLDPIIGSDDESLNLSNSEKLKFNSNIVEPGFIELNDGSKLAYMFVKYIRNESARESGIFGREGTMDRRLGMVSQRLEPANVMTVEQAEALSEAETKSSNRTSTKRSSPNSKDNSKENAKTTTTTNKRLAILFSHGNGEDLGGMVDFLVNLGHILKVDFFCYDYNGYGLSTGQACESILYSNVIQAYNFLKEKYDYLDEEIVIYGQSIGTVSSVHLAALKGKEKKKIAGLILHSPLLSGYKVLYHKADNSVFCRSAMRCYNPLPSSNKINSVKCKVLVIHGTDDRVIDFNHGLNMYELCENKFEPLWVEGAGHNDIHYYPEYCVKLKEVIEEIRECVPCRSVCDVWFIGFK